jgi:hypothetical protein
MPGTGRVLYAALHLLDHQMIDRHGEPCGNVDDLELEEAPDGALIVTNLLAGPGVLAERLGHAPLGRWWRRAVTTDEAVRIPFDAIMEITSKVQVGVDRDDLATFATERWARDRVDRVPGASKKSRQGG